MLMYRPTNRTPRLTHANIWSVRAGRGVLGKRADVEDFLTPDDATDATGTPATAAADVDTHRRLRYASPRTGPYHAVPPPAPQALIVTDTLHVTLYLTSPTERL